MGSARNKIHMYYIRFYMVICVGGRMYIYIYNFFEYLCLCWGGVHTYEWLVGWGGVSGMIFGRCDGVR